MAKLKKLSKAEVDELCGFCPWRTLIGKTIQEVDIETACNVVNLKFTDGSVASLESEPIGGGLFTTIISDYQEGN